MWVKVKHKHIWQNPNKVKSVSWNKYEKAINHYKKLIKRQEVEWETKWIKNALIKVKAKFKKYGITESMVK